MKTFARPSTPITADDLKDIMKDAGTWPPLQYYFMGTPISEWQFKHLSTLINTFPPKTLMAQPSSIFDAVAKPASLGTKRVFYVMQHSVSKNFWINGASKWTDSAQGVNGASQFSTVQELTRALRITRDNEGLAYANIVRVERTTTPGKVIPAKEVRTIVTGAPESTDKWALKDGLWFLTAPAMKANNFRTTDIAEASLFDSDSRAIEAVTEAAVASEYSYYGIKIVRVRVTKTPTTNEPDTVNDVLTVLE